MIKLSHYTNFNDLKKDNRSATTNSTSVVNDNELKDFLEFIRSHKVAASVKKDTKPSKSR